MLLVWVTLSINKYSASLGFFMSAELFLTSTIDMVTTLQ